jgi:hypothetical protein
MFRVRFASLGRMQGAMAERYTQKGIDPARPPFGTVRRKRSIE